MHRQLVRRTNLITIAGCIPFLLIGCVGAWFVHHIHQINAQLLSRHVNNVLAAEELEIEMRDIRNRMNRYLRTNNQAYLDQIPKLRTRTTQLLTEARARAQSPEEIQLVGTLQDGYDRFFSRFQELASQLPSPVARAGLSDLIDNLMAREVFTPARQIVQLHQQETVRMAEFESQLANRMGVELVLLGACGAVAGGVGGFGLARRLQRMFIQLRVSAHGMAGQLAEVVEPVSIDSGGKQEDLESTLQQISSRVTMVVERFHESQREVQRAEQLVQVGRLAAGLAHELRNALMPVKLLVGSALQDESPMTPEELTLVANEVDRVELAVTRLLEFARPVLPEKSLIDLRTIAAESLLLITGRAKNQSVVVNCRTPSQAAIVDADKELLRQVIINLLLNALDAMPEGGELTVSVQESNGANNHAETNGAVANLSQNTAAKNTIKLAVADTGCGIAATLLERLFEPFVTTKATGTGLGLSICKQIVEAHGGRIGGSNRGSCGALFTVELPAYRA